MASHNSHLNFLPWPFTIKSVNRDASFAHFGRTCMKNWKSPRKLQMSVSKAELSTENNILILFGFPIM